MVGQVRLDIEWWWCVGHIPPLDILPCYKYSNMKNLLTLFLTLSIPLTISITLDWYHRQVFSTFKWPQPWGNVRGGRPGGEKLRSRSDDLARLEWVRFAVHGWISSEMSWSRSNSTGDPPRPRRDTATTPAGRRAVSLDLARWPVGRRAPREVPYSPSHWCQVGFRLLDRSRRLMRWWHLKPATTAITTARFCTGDRQSETVNYVLPLTTQSAS